QNSEHAMNRRDLFKTAAAAGLASALGETLGLASADPAAPDRVRHENEMPGTKDWMATNVRIDRATKYRSPWIEGYASRTSLRPGETISFHVSTNPASAFTIDIYRLGYYQGHGGRFVQRLGPFKGNVQPEPPVAPM